MIEQVNTIAQIWWNWMWPMFWQVSVLIGFIALIDFLIRRHVWPQVRYALWLLVLLKLLMPPSFALRTSIVSRVQPMVERSIRQRSAPDDSLYTLLGERTSLDGPSMTRFPHAPASVGPAAGADVVESPAYVDTSIIAANVVKADLSWRAIAMLGWAVPMLLLMLRLLLKHRAMWRVNCLPERGRALPTWLPKLVEDTAKKLHLRQAPQVVLSSTVNCPAVLGVFRPVLLIPEQTIERLSQQQAEHILLHELAHIKRRDLPVHALCVLMQIFYWFNPLLALVRRQLQHLRELCCDATVVGILKNKAEDYSQTILWTVEWLLEKPHWCGIGLLGLIEDPSRLRVRLEWLRKKPSRHPGLRTVTAMILVVAMLAFILPMAKAQNSPKNGASSTTELQERSDDSRASADRIFGNPTNLGSPVNSFADDYGPNISADELELYFSSYRPDGLGKDDLWVTTRRTKADSWGDPVNLGPTVNSPAGDGAPCISADGLSLYFSSDRPGEHGGQDLWMSTRKTKTAPWGKPVNIGPTVNSEAHEIAPSISSDGLELYFSSHSQHPESARPGGSGGIDLWVTTRKTNHDHWGEPVNLGPIVNSSFGDSSLSISGDGLSLYFNSDRPGGSGVGDLWVTTRKSKSEPWSTPVNVGPTVNSGGWDVNPNISRDGSILYFSSSRSIGVGGVDIWQATLEQRSEETPESKAQSEMDASLHEAVKAGDIEQVRSLLSKGAGVNAKDKKGRTSLHWATWHGRREAAQVLIAKGANVNEADASGQTPLHIAANFGTKFVPELLLAKGAYISARDIAGNTPLHAAADGPDVNQDLLELMFAKGADVKATNEAGQTPLHRVSMIRRQDKRLELTAEVLLTHGAEVDAKDKSGNTPFHFAVENGHRKLIELLLAKGADVKATAADGTTPLHRAATRGHSDVVELLLERGVDINAKTVSGETPAQLAALSNRKDTVKLLFSKGAEVSTIQLAAYVGDLAKVKSFIEQGISVNTQDEYWPALHAAAASGQREVAEFLINNGASVNAQAVGQYGETPLHSAARGGSREVTELLMSKGATIDASDNYGMTALYRAALTGDADIVKLLIDHGADVNAQDTYGRRPLELAAWADSDEVIKLLIDKGAVVSKDDMPLAWACMNGHKDLAELLIKKGANVNSKSWGNAVSLETILSGFMDLQQKADRPRFLAILALLFDNGADPNAKDRWDWSLLHYACFYACGETDLPRLLLDKGANPNAIETERGRTPLHIVVGHCDDKAVAQLLLSSGADVNIKDYYGRTPLPYAEDLGDNDMFGRPRSTPLTAEAKAAKKEIAELLRQHGATE
jgi:ankyrin repeat protein/beta-lactamase regulating signal transducer with metallopeptidase domain